MRYYMTLTEAAHAIGVSNYTIARWIQQGKLPYVWVGGRRRVDSATVQQLAQAYRSSHEEHAEKQED